MSISESVYTNLFKRLTFAYLENNGTAIVETTDLALLLNELRRYQALEQTEHDIRHSGLVIRVTGQGPRDRKALINTIIGDIILRGYAVNDTAFNFDNWIEYVQVKDTNDKSFFDPPF